MRSKRNGRETGRIGKRGVVVIPAPMRRRLRLEEGDLVIVEERGDGVLIRPAVALPVERYSPARRAHLLLNNATDDADYRRARTAVRAMGLNPDDVEHRPPPGRRRSRTS